MRSSHQIWLIFYLACVWWQVCGCADNPITRLRPIGMTGNSRSLNNLSLMSLGLMPTANGLLSGCPQKRNGRKLQEVVSSKRSILGAMNLRKIVRTLVKSTACRCR